MPWLEIRGKAAPGFPVESPPQKSLISLLSHTVRQETGCDKYTLLRHSYMSPTAVMESREPAYICPQFCAQADWQSYIFSRKDSVDSVKITFDIPEAMFYLRSDMKLIDNETDPDCKILLTTTDNQPSFFICYKPAFIHDVFKVNGVTVDLLCENVDGQNSSPADIRLKNRDDRQEADTLKNFISRIIMSIDSCVGEDNELSEKTLNLVVSKMLIQDMLGNDSTVWSFGRAFSQKNSDPLIIIDKSEFYSSMPVHEILHLYYPITEEIEKYYSFYEYTLIKESLIEYVASVISEELFGIDEFDDKLKYLRTHGYGRKEAVKASSINSNAAFSTDGSSSWLYYQYIPCQLHKIARQSGGDKIMSIRIMRFLDSIIDANWNKKAVDKGLDKLKSLLQI